MFLPAVFISYCDETCFCVSTSWKSSRIAKHLTSACVRHKHTKCECVCACVTAVSYTEVHTAIRLSGRGSSCAGVSQRNAWDFPLLHFCCESSDSVALSCFRLTVVAPLGP